MSDIKIQTVQKNLDSILQSVGTQSYISWDKFSHSSAEIINSIDQLNKRVSIFRECQHRNFIQTMKKLKSLDIPDLIGAVKSKKLPRQALRGVLTRFKQGQNGKIQLADTVESLKQNATKQFEQYVKKNNTFLQELRKFSNFVDQRSKQFGFAPEKPSQSPIVATVKFDLSQQLATKIASNIKIQHIPGTSYIGLRTYSQITQGSYELIKQQSIRLTKDARKKQRQNIKDDKKYLSIMNEYLLNSEALIIEGQKLLARKVGLSENKLEESQLLMMERGLGNHLLMLQSQLRAKIKQHSIAPVQDVSLEVAKQVIVYQIDMLRQKKNEIKKILDGVEKTQDSVQTIPMLLAFILNDMVFEKYGYEEQDFMKNVTQEVISKNQQFANIFKEMQVQIIKLMQFIGIIPHEVGNVMEQNVLGRGQNPQQTYPNLAPGMMQNSNPMQMLQMQQMQQMQQMLSNSKGGQK